MARVMYALVEPNAFRIPANTGPTVAYPHHPNLSRAKQTQIDRIYRLQKNYYLSYANVYCTVLDLLYGIIDNSFKLTTSIGGRRSTT